MIEVEKKIVEFWETCGLSYAHLIDGKRGKGLCPGSRLEGLLKSEFIDKMSFKEKTIIDYGCGGGFITGYLLDHQGLKHSICFDIANRSLSKAKENLKRHLDKVTFQILPVKLNEWEADYFLSLAVIQHFPNKEYLDNFLDNLNKIKVDKIVLQIRNNNKTQFNNAYDSEDGNKGLACQTNPGYISNKLGRYKLIYEGGISPTSKYQYIIYD
jgi:2-polyprenyl-3-methyl-5-hydroxy-6-metoxy-1,4-benzoquinol methylase